MYWIISSTANDYICSWGDEVVVYDVVSGITHLLDKNASILLQKLSIASADLLMLTTHLAKEINVVENEEMLLYVAGILENLHNLSLIERF